MRVSQDFCTEQVQQEVKSNFPSYKAVLQAFCKQYFETYFENIKIKTFQKKKENLN